MYRFQLEQKVIKEMKKKQQQQIVRDIKEKLKAIWNNKCISIHTYTW